MSYDLATFIAENARRGIVPVLLQPHPLKNAIRVAIGLRPMPTLRTFRKVKK